MVDKFGAMPPLAAHLDILKDTFRSNRYDKASMGWGLPVEVNDDIPW